jgi:hypothetical protein
MSSSDDDDDHHHDVSLQDSDVSLSMEEFSTGNPPSDENAE